MLFIQMFQNVCRPHFSISSFCSIVSTIYISFLTMGQLAITSIMPVMGCKWSVYTFQSNHCLLVSLTEASFLHSHSRHVLQTQCKRYAWSKVSWNFFRDCWMEVYCYDEHFVLSHIYKPDWLWSFNAFRWVVCSHFILLRYARFDYQYPNPMWCVHFFS